VAVGLELTVADDGRGADVALDRRRCIGLRSMLERAESRGWSLDVRSETGERTT